MPVSSPSSTGRDASVTPTSVSNVPDDILFDIFNILVRDEALPKYDSIDLDLLIQVIPAMYPWTLAAVCRRWRALCLQESVLWSYIEFPEHDCSNTSFRRPHILLLRVLLQVERSRAAPLCIRSNISCHCECQLAHWMALIPHSARWRELRIQMEPDQTAYFQVLTSQLDSSTVFPALERLHFIDNTERPEMVPFPHDGRIVFVALRSVILRGIREMDSETDPVGLPWHRLTSIAIHDYYGDFSHFIMTLSRCKSLIDLSFSVGENPSPPLYPSLDDIERTVPKDSITIPHLTSLTLKNSKTPLEKRILPFLRLPSLRYLVFGAVNANEEFNQDIEDYGLRTEPEPCDTLVDLIARSGCMLTELAVHCRAYHEPFARLLTMLPRLRFLHMEFEGDANSLRQTLCPAGSMYPFPSLEHLSLSCYAWGEHEDILSAVKSRLDSPDVSHLKILRLGINGKDRNRTGEENRMAQMVEERLWENVCNGLDIKFTLTNGHISLDVPRVYTIPPLN